jgi:protease-4
MAGKKHPILIVLAILAGVGLVLGITMIIVLKIFSPSSNLPFSAKIGVIPIEGTILTSQAVTAQLVKFEKDKSIKAVILRINSPGGAVGPTQEIYREVQKTVETKKVVASLGGVAASGGYYIAAAAKKIVANPGTITGSIGVLMEFVRFEELLKKIGVKLEVLKSGEFKDIGSPHRKLTDRDKELLSALITDIQKQFVEAVASGRNLTLEKTHEIADGRIFSGARAKELGLVDVLGNFQDAVEIAKNMAGIKGDVTLVYPKKSKLELWDLFFDSAADSVIKRIHEMKTRIEYRWNGPLGW